MKFCSNCAAAVVQRVPPGDNLPRWVCDQCGEIHYQNPRMVVGSIPEHEGRILLCRRAIEPRYGYWTLPAGFMENDETTGQAALRETLEEAGARIELGAPSALASPAVAADSQPRFYARARLVDENGAPLRGKAIPVQQNLIFHYPFAATPCFLLNLGRPARASVQLKTAENRTYEWDG